jgi:hypothetical protein
METSRKKALGVAIRPGKGRRELGARVVLWGALALVLVLQGVALREQSLSGDGAHHLLAGEQALRWGQNRLNLEHPPLAKMVFAAPSLGGEPFAPPLVVEEALPWVSRVHAEPQRLHRATFLGRLGALLVFVLPFFAATAWLGRRHGGPRTGLLLVLFLGLSFCVLPQLTVLQTDTAVALAFVLTVICAERYLERPGRWRAVGLAGAAALGLVSKFSALLLGPAVVLTWLVAWRRHRGWRFVLHGLLMTAVVLVALEGVYRLANRDYDPEVGRGTIHAYCSGEGTVVSDHRLAAWEERLLALETVDPYLTQWLTGLLALWNQNAIGVYASYAFGEVSSSGRWWYFPAVLLLKIPLVLLALGLWWVVRRERRSRAGPSLLPMAAVVGVYLAVALTSNYNLGVRHLLPVLPFLFLFPARFLAERGSPASAVVVLLLAAESLALAPLWMSANNTWWLGRHDPARLALGTGNLEFRQNFRQLGRFMDEQGLERLGVLYPTLAPEVLAAWAPRAHLVTPGHPPVLEPGWYAVNVTVEQLVPALLAAPEGAVYQGEALRREAERWRPLWRAVQGGEDHGYAAGTFHIYRLATPVEPAP